MRARAVHLDSANEDGTSQGLSTNDQWLPEVDFTDVLDPNLAAERILPVPQRQKAHASVPNTDIKNGQTSTKVLADGHSVGRVEVDPLLLGIGKRF